MPSLDQTRIAIAGAIGCAAVLLAFLVLSPAPASIAPPAPPQTAAPVPVLVPID